ncbi:hypothetical protein Q8F57_039590 [Paraburkholderia terrae]|nr:hypothetical protein [Paraburkholderia terrae]MDW3658688.1 hypothetical protein [Paraburkholderia terrae]
MWTSAKGIRERRATSVMWAPTFGGSMVEHNVVSPCLFNKQQLELVGVV